MDTRTLRQKLEAMAARGTEHEREIAREKLAAMGEQPPPPRPPTSTGPMSFDEFFRRANSTSPAEMTFYGPNGEKVTIRGNFTVNGGYNTSTVNTGW